jgi:hypothetical protein
MNHKTMEAVKATPTMPPTTPPAILPEFELPLDDVSDEGGEGALGATVDWLFLVEVETRGTLPVTSGGSVTGAGHQGKPPTIIGGNHGVTY